MKINRRKFLLSAALIGGGGILMVSLKGSSLFGEQSFYIKLSDVIVFPKHADRIARIYIKEHHPDVSKNELLAKLFSGLGWWNRFRSSFSLRKLLERKVRSDFAEGRTLKMHGWILAQTEIDLCVLVHFLKGDLFIQESEASDTN
ncbi:MAG: hypothetical protein KDD53_03305 [Bdellovibrionales bacterium]|nr:hypothetical protein [Bdellovibrionales bacterium]